MKKLDKQEIITKAGISIRHLNYILNKERKPGPKLATTLEEITGVNRLCWLYPDEYENPYISRIHEKH